MPELVGSYTHDGEYLNSDYLENVSPHAPSRGWHPGSDVVLEESDRFFESRRPPAHQKKRRLEPERYVIKGGGFQRHETGEESRRILR